MEAERDMVTPGEVIAKTHDVKAGRGTYAATHNNTVYASLTGFRHTIPPASDSPDQRPIVEVTGHKAHGPVPEPGSVVIVRVTKVMTKIAEVDIMCVGQKSVREKFTGVISSIKVDDNVVALSIISIYWFWVALSPYYLKQRQQDVRATEIDKVDMHLSFRPGDIVKAIVLSLGNARAYFLSTAKNELGVVSAESTAGATLVPISWTEMQCPLSGQIEQRKVAKVSS